MLVPAPDLSADYVYRATVVKWVDGDSVWLHLEKDFEIDLGFRIGQTVTCHTEQNFRLADINCPEMRKPTHAAGEAALAFLQGLFEEKEILAHTEKTGKYGRYLVHLYAIEEDEQATYINETLVESGHAVKYGDPIPERWKDETPE
jgi:endonuclease YncB( thermonuclease family)